MSATVLAGAVVLFVAVLAAGFLLGWLVLSKVRRKGVDSARVTAQKIVSEAEVQTQALVKTTGLEVRDEWRREREPLERELEAAKRASRPAWPIASNSSTARSTYSRARSACWSNPSRTSLSVRAP